MNDLDLFACEDVGNPERKIWLHDPLEKFDKHGKSIKYFFLSSLLFPWNTRLTQQIKGA